MFHLRVMELKHQLYHLYGHLVGLVPHISLDHLPSWPTYQYQRIGWSGYPYQTPLPFQPPTQTVSLQSVISTNRQHDWSHRKSSLRLKIRNIISSWQAHLHFWRKRKRSLVLDVIFFKNSKLKFLVYSKQEGHDGPWSFPWVILQ